MNNNFPIVQTNADLDIVTRIRMEGMTEASVVVQTPVGYALDGTKIPETDGAIYTAHVGLNQKPLPTRIGLLTNVDLFSTAAVRVNIAFPQQQFICVGGEFGQYSKQPNKIILSGNSFFAGIVGLVRPVKDAGGTVTNKFFSTFSAQMIYASADMNYQAKQRIFFCGDSNTEGGSMAANIDTLTTIKQSDYYSFMLRDWFNANGNDCRLIDKSLGGKSSTEFNQYKNRGQLDLPETPNMIFYVLGTNDTDAALYKTNLQKFIAWAFEKWPSTRIVVCGNIPGPGNWPDGTSGLANGTPRETVSAVVRQNASDVVTAFANPSKLIYINLGAAWDINDTTMYTNIGGGNGHAGPLGQIAMFNKIKTEITNNYPSFKKL